MNSNLFWTAIITTIACLLSVSAQVQNDPGVRGGFANTAGELERGGIPNKRNRHRRIAFALAAMFALAGSAATAQSTLTGENAKELRRLLAVPAQNIAVSCSDRTPPRTPASALDRFLMWNEIALDTTAIDHTPDSANPSCFGEQLGPTRASYALAIVHIAMFDAANAITQKYVSYAGVPPVSGNVSLERAIAQAAHDALIALYPGQKARLDAIFDADIVRIPGTRASIEAGAALGAQAANAVLALRQNDGSALPEPRWFVDYFPIGFPNVQPGIWQIDQISNLKVALGGNWPKVKPFVMTSASQFRAPPPPSLKSTAFKETFNEEVRIGGDHGTNTSRTEPQTFEAVFWGYDGTPGLCAPPRLYNMITCRHRLVGFEIFLPVLAASYSHSRTIRPQFLSARRSRHQHGGSELHAAVSGLYIRPRNIWRCLVPDAAPFLAGRNTIYFCFG